jgi:dihydroorotase
MSTTPARIFHLPGGTLKRGAPADVVIFDGRAPWVVDPSRFLSKSRNTPFTAWELRGRVERTLVGGRTVYQAS